MNEDTREIAKAGIQQAVNGGVVASAAGIVTGAAMTTVTTTTPITILWGLIATGSTVVTAPVVLPAALAICAVGGAVIGGTAGAVRAYHKIWKINKEFEALKNGDE